MYTIFVENARMLVNPYSRLLRERHPIIFSMLHPTLNDPTAVAKMKVTSNKKFIWRCPFDPCGHHVWEASTGNIIAAIIKRGNIACPYHSSQKICVCNSLANLRPDLMDEWDHEENAKNGLFPDRISLHSGEKAWWFCTEMAPDCGHHRWEGRIADRTSTRGRRCPFHNGTYTCRCDSFMVKFPRLALEFDSVRNHGIDPYKTAPYANIKLWWIGLDCKHSWCTTLYNRTLGGTHCPRCKKSHLERQCEYFLNKLKLIYNIEFELQKSPDDCRNPHTGRPLFFDVIVRGFRLDWLIELDGQQHFYETDFGKKEKQLPYTQYKDRVKDQYAHVRQKYLTRISFSEMDNMETHLITTIEAILNHERQYEIPPAVTNFIGVEYQFLNQQIA